MDASARQHQRQGCEACRCEILDINGASPEPGKTVEGLIENISKGGFRFLANVRLELEDRLTARIYFSNGLVHESRGRICYCDENAEGGVTAYGFSVLSGFYPL